jgi:hypothetical protein
MLFCGLKHCNSRPALIPKARVLAASCALLAAGAATADPAPATPPPSPSASTAPAQPSPLIQERDKAVGIVSQPVRDVGVKKSKIPPPLVKAVESPYGLEGLKTCGQLSGAIVDLNSALGADFAAGTKYHENHAVKLAEAGGKTVVNSLLPFRGLVREVSGAAPADRRYEAAVNMGYARRGFLRGVYLQRRCKPTY